MSHCDVTQNLLHRVFMLNQLEMQLHMLQLHANIKNYSYHNIFKLSDTIRPHLDNHNPYQKLSSILEYASSWDSPHLTDKDPLTFMLNLQHV